MWCWIMACDGEGLFRSAACYLHQLLTEHVAQRQVTALGYLPRGEQESMCVCMCGLAISLVALPWTLGKRRERERHEKERREGPTFWQNSWIVM